MGLTITSYICISILITIYCKYKCFSSGLKTESNIQSIGKIMGWSGLRFLSVIILLLGFNFAFSWGSDQHKIIVTFMFVSEVIYMLIFIPIVDSKTRRPNFNSRVELCL